MDILIPDNWLREYLNTTATCKEISKYLSLCGPSVEKIIGKGSNAVYSIEVTTNRVDMMSIYGIAREASTIIPEFGKKAKLTPPKIKKINNKTKLKIIIKNDATLCKRILAVKIENVKVNKSPNKIAERLKSVGQRSLNNLIDITNYMMWETGHPIHVFDYDKIIKLGGKIIVREAKKGERLTTLDGKTYKMHGGEVVFGNGKGVIIDLPGIMGTKNTVVDSKTQNILLWIESVDPVRVRKASMSHSIRSQAAILNEKGVDPELGLLTVLLSAQMYLDLAGGEIASELVDIYPSLPKTKKIKTTHEFIESRLGVPINKKRVKNILDNLGIQSIWRGNTLVSKIPSFRANDMDIQEDILEEVARIYGYHNLPSQIMPGVLPEPLSESPFAFENKLKETIKNMNGIEIYTYSMVPERFADKNALRISNPLGKEGEYMRTNLTHSLINAVVQNKQESNPYHIFEVANVYLPRKNELPQEKMMLAGIFCKIGYTNAKGVIEKLLKQINSQVNEYIEDDPVFKKGTCIKFLKGKLDVGKIGILRKTDNIYYEFDVEKLKSVSNLNKKFKPIPTHPPQIEDLTLIIPQDVLVGDVMDVLGMDKNVVEVKLVDRYKKDNSYTFRLWYQAEHKTLTDREVETIRNKTLHTLRMKLGIESK